MKCKVFEGPWNQTMDAFNYWAKDKALSRDVIIHTQAVVAYKAAQPSIYLIITVYHPEGAPWEGASDKWEQAVKEKSIKPTASYEKAITQ